MDKNAEAALLEQLMGELELGQSAPPQSHSKSPKGKSKPKKEKTTKPKQLSFEELTPGDRLDEVRSLILANLKDAKKLLAATPLPPRTPGASIYQILGKERIIAISITFYNKVYTWEYAPFIDLFRTRLVALPIAIEDQAMLFMQWFGGPPVFSEQKGNPAMRLRHAQFRITPADRDQWIKYMTETLDEIFKNDFPTEKKVILEKMVEQAHYLTNCEENGKRIYGPVPDKDYIRRIGELQRSWNREDYENSAEKIDFSHSIAPETI